LPSHHGFGASCAAVKYGVNAGATAAAPIALIRFRRENLDLVMKILVAFQFVNGYGYAFSHKPIPSHREKEGHVIPA
jgi:hypothetical protein